MCLSNYYMTLANLCKTLSDLSLIENASSEIGHLCLDRQKNQIRQLFPDRESIVKETKHNEDLSCSTLMNVLQSNIAVCHNMLVSKNADTWKLVPQRD